MAKTIRFFNDSEHDPSETVWRYEIASEIPIRSLKLKDIKILDDWDDGKNKTKVARRILKDIREGNFSKHLSTHSYTVTTVIHGRLVSINTVIRK